MKKNLLLLFMSLHFIAQAQVFEVETIWQSGSIDDRINFVIMGDGYRDIELVDFMTHAEDFTNELFNETRFKEYKNFFNVFAIKVISNESGASHPGTATDVGEPAHPIADVDNYFGSTFDFAGTHRLLVPTNTVALNNVLATNFPNYDQPIVIVNSPHYGGSGGPFATTSLQNTFGNIAIHEVGHSFAALADEYYAGDALAAERANMTQETNPTLVKWKNWMGSNGVGIYQHCCGGNSSSWYKPHESCKMESLLNPFCSVCSEGIIEKIYELVNPIESYAPNADPVDLTQETTFSLNVIEPTPNTFEFEWRLNGNLFDSGSNSTALSLDDLSAQDNQLVGYAIDETELLRPNDQETLHIFTVTWNVNGAVVSVDEVAEQQFKLSLYPNPTTNLLNIRHDLSQNYHVIITDLLGKELLRNDYTSGQNEIQIPLQSLKSGIYLVNIYFENGLVLSRKIVKE